MSNGIVYIFVSKDYKKSLDEFRVISALLCKTSRDRPTERTLKQGYVNDNGMSVNMITVKILIYYQHTLTYNLEL